MENEDRYSQLDQPDKQAPIVEREGERHDIASSYHDRDLGTAGGGRIPGGLTSGTGNPPGGMSTSNSMPQGSSPAAAYGGQGETRERGSTGMADASMSGPSDAHRNAASHIPQSTERNLGGRNPDQPQTSMGDRDAKVKPGSASNRDQGPNAARRDYTNMSEDPMSSRLPDQDNA